MTLLPVLVAMAINIGIGYVIAKLDFEPFYGKDEAIKKFKDLVIIHAGTGLLIAVVELLYNYFSLPAMTPGYLINLTALNIILMWLGYMFFIGDSDVSHAYRVKRLDSVKISRAERILLKSLFVFGIIVGLTLILTATSSFFFAYKSHVIAGEVFSPISTVSLGNNSSVIANLSYSDIQFTVIPYETAFRRMSSATSNYGIIYKVADADYQLINGTVYWVGSITYGDFWKWWKNRNNGIPFVIMLKATENDEAKVVKLKEPMKYSLGNYLGNNVERFLWEKYPEYKRTIPVLQIHNGRAYYVSMLLKPTADSLWSVYKPYKLAVIDAHTGEVKLYNLDKVPKWVTFVHQEDEVEKYLYDYFVYVHGLWNAHFGQKDVVYPTGNIFVDVEKHEVSMSGTDVWMVFIRGHPYWYSALRPPSSKYSMVALALVDAKTGKLTLIKTPGYYNDLASIQNILQSPEVAKTNTLKPTQPIPVLIRGHFAWLSTVISQNNELQFFALVDASNGKVYSDTTLRGVISKWVSTFSSGSQVSVSPGAKVGEYVITIKYANGSVERIPVSLNTTIVVSKGNETVLVYNVKK